MKIRQLTKNEKVLLTLLAIVILFWLSYKFIYIPQSEKLASLVLERAEYEAEIEDINTTLRKEKSIKKEWQELNDRQERIVSSYFPTLDQPQIIYLLSELTANENVEIQDLSFSRPSVDDFEDFQVTSMDVSIPYSGNYQGIIDMLNSINTSPRKITIDNLSMDRNAGDELSGNMSLRVYSLDGIAESNPEVIYVDTANGNKENPFAGNKDLLAAIEKEGGLADGNSSGFENGFVDGIEGGFEGAEGQGNVIGPGSVSTQVAPYIEEVLLDFETNNSYFVPSQELVKGDVSLSTNSKSKRHSLKLEYNIVAIEEENRAFVDITKNNIVLRYPPNSIGIWIYSYDYLPVTFGIGFKGQMGEDVRVPFTEGIGWKGWKYVEASPPTDLELYPLKLERLYIEIANGRDNYGVILIDKLEALYSRNIDEDGNDASAGEFMFHVVSRGDSLESISQRYYGSKDYVNEIRKLNEFKAGDILSVEKVLILKKH